MLSNEQKNKATYETKCAVYSVQSRYPFAVYDLADITNSTTFYINPDGTKLAVMHYDSLDFYFIGASAELHRLLMDLKNKGKSTEIITIMALLHAANQETQLDAKVFKQPSVADSLQQLPNAIRKKIYRCTKSKESSSHSSSSNE